MKRRADGLYQKGVTTYLPDGRKKVVVVYGKSQAEVKRKALALQERQIIGATFKEVAESWLNERYTEYSPNTVKTLKAPYNRAVDHFGDQNIREISAPQISAYIKRFASGHSDGTVRAQLLVFSLI